MKFCSDPFDTIFINTYGQISSCLCPGWHKKGMNMGNLHQETFKDAVNTVAFREMRASVIDQSFRFCLKDQCHKLYSLQEVTQLPPKFPSLPTNINLGIDYNCNLKCPSCRNKNIYSKDVNPNAKKILDTLVDAYQNFEQTVTIYCDATGDVFASSAYREFFMRPDLPKCFKFCIQTNGNLITKNLDLIDKIHNQLDIFIISFDAATDETYKITRGGVLDLVIAGVKSLVERNISVTTQYVLQYANYHEVVEYYKLCKTLGVQHIGVQKLDAWGHINNNWWKLNQLDQNPQINYEQLLKDLVSLKQDPMVGFCGGIEEFINRMSSVV